MQMRRRREEKKRDFLIKILKYLHCLFSLNLNSFYFPNKQKRNETKRLILNETKNTYVVVIYRY